MEPTFPSQDVERMRDERLNDLLQAKADPRRRADDAFVETIYAPGTPYSRPSAGTEETVPELDADATRALHARLLDPARMTLIVGGDLEAVGEDVRSIAESRFGAWAPLPNAITPSKPKVVPARSERIVRVIHRPGSVQTEIRVGHVGLPRLVPDFHAVSVMSAILGGLFNSRLNRKLREEKGYTYGAGAGFDMRRGPGPFAVRAAVNTEVTVPGDRGHARRAREDARGAAGHGRAPRRPRLPRRRLPAAVRDAAGRRRRDRRPPDPRAADGRARSVSPVDRGRLRRATSRASRHATSGPTSSRSSSSATPTRSCRSLEGAALGPITVEREELPAEVRRGHERDSPA